MIKLLFIITGTIMGYEFMINSLLSNSDKKMRDCADKMWQEDRKTYNKLDKQFEKKLLSFKQYKREDFISMIENSVYGKAWEELSDNKRKTIIRKIEPILMYEKSFADHLNKFNGIECVFLETKDRIVVYCNGMYGSMSEEKDGVESLRFALRAPIITVCNNKQLEKFAQENKKFPIWLNQLEFLKTELGSFWDYEQRMKII